MPRTKVSDEEWQMFLSVADRLQIPVGEMTEGEVRFSVIESTGHRFGRAVAQITTGKQRGKQRCQGERRVKPAESCG